jgi:glycosyltransferase involved in cell wall biosynthesis
VIRGVPLAAAPSAETLPAPAAAGLDCPRARRAFRLRAVEPMSPAVADAGGLRLALLTATLSPAAGGLAAAVPATAAALDTAGAETRVLSLADRDDAEAWRDWGPRVHAHAARGPRFYPFAPGLARSLAQLAPDVVDVHGLWLDPSRASLAHHRRTRRPYVVTPHGMLDPWAVRRSRWKKALVLAAFERAHLGRAGCVRVTAEMEADHVRAFGVRAPLAVVPNGVALPAARRPPARDRPTRRLLFLSRLHPKKGLDHLLRAWAALAPAHPDWELAVAGPDELGHTAAMRRLARALEVPRVRWLGPVHGAAKSRLYHDSDVFVLPTHAENFGLVVAEALAHELPVVTTTNAPWAGLEREGCGWWVPLGGGALGEALAAALALGDDARAAMGARGRAWVARRFTWAAVAAALVPVYRWLAGGGPPPAAVRTD